MNIKNNELSYQLMHLNFLSNSKRILPWGSCSPPTFWIPDGVISFWKHLYCLLFTENIFRKNWKQGKCSFYAFIANYCNKASSNRCVYRYPLICSYVQRFHLLNLCHMTCSIRWYTSKTFPQFSAFQITFFQRSDERQEICIRKFFSQPFRRSKIQLDVPSVGEHCECMFLSD